MKLTTEENIADAMLEALDDLSDKNLAALKEAFDSGMIADAHRLIKMIYREIESQVRYRDSAKFE